MTNLSVLEEQLVAALHARAAVTPVTRVEPPVGGEGEMSPVVPLAPRKRRNVRRIAAVVGIAAAAAAIVTWKVADTHKAEPQIVTNPSRGDKGVRVPPGSKEVTVLAFRQQPVPQNSVLGPEDLCVDRATPCARVLYWRTVHYGGVAVTEGYRDFYLDVTTSNLLSYSAALKDLKTDAKNGTGQDQNEVAEPVPGIDGAWWTRRSSRVQSVLLRHGDVVAQVKVQTSGNRGDHGLLKRTMLDLLKAARWKSSPPDIAGVYYFGADSSQSGAAGFELYPGAVLALRTVAPFCDSGSCLPKQAPEGPQQCISEWNYGGFSGSCLPIDFSEGPLAVGDRAQSEWATIIPTVAVAPNVSRVDAKVGKTTVRLKLIGDADAFGFRLAHLPRDSYDRSDLLVQTQGELGLPVSATLIGYDRRGKAVDRVAVNSLSSLDPGFQTVSQGQAVPGYKWIFGTKNGATSGATTPVCQVKLEGIDGHTGACGGIVALSSSVSTWAVIVPAETQTVTINGVQGAVLEAMQGSNFRVAVFDEDKFAKSNKSVATTIDAFDANGDLLRRWVNIPKLETLYRHIFISDEVGIQGARDAADAGASSSAPSQ